MAKIRVYELARDLGVDSKQITTYMANKGRNLTPSSGIEDEDVKMIQEHFRTGQSARGEAAAPKEKPGATPQSGSHPSNPSARAQRINDEHPRPKTDAAAGSSDQPAAKPKKRHVKFVINHQNMSGGSGQGNNRRPRNDRNPRQDNRGRRRGDEMRPRQQSASGASKPLIKPRGLVSQRTLNPSPAEVAEAEEARRIKEQEREAAAIEAAKLAEAQEEEKNKEAANQQPDTVAGAPEKNAPVNAPASDESGITEDAETIPAVNDKTAGTVQKENDSAQSQRKADHLAPDKFQNASAPSRRPDQKAARPSADQTRQEHRPQRRQAGPDNAKVGLRIIGHMDIKPADRRPRSRNQADGRTDRRQSEGRTDRRSDRSRENGMRQSSRDERRGGRGAAEPASQERSRDNRHGNDHRNGHRRNEKETRKQENFINLEKTTTHKHHSGSKAQERNMDEILTIQIPEHLTIHELADKMKVTPADVIKKLFMQGTMATMNTEVDFEQAEQIAEEFNCICEKEDQVNVIEELLQDEEDDPSTLVPRPPVVAVMGHVDHGKTSLLDAIRHTNVTEGEAGGITQAIGAYTVDVKGRKITFLDTPGHEAFTAMRMRGAQATDIAVLVVAADDGVMPQTVEAINHAKAAEVEIIVAINKIDKPGANVDRVKQELTEYGLVAEDWGGDTTMVPVSAKTKEGLSDLLDMILLTADVMELKANPNRAARGLIIEARLDKGRGVVATALVQKGTLHVGDYVAAGASYGRVRAMIDDKHKRVRSAGPSMPVAIQGLSEVPNAGEIFNALDSEKEARNYAEAFVEESRNRLLDETRARANLNNIFDQIQSGEMKELDVIVKADVQGSVEAVRSSLLKLSNDEVAVKVIHAGVGAINESDVILASASNAIIIGFNVRPDAVAKSTAEEENVDIRLYTVIYNAIEDVESAMKGMLEPVYEEKIIGHAQVRQLFKASGVGNIAGSYVLDGTIERGCKVRVMRGDDQIFEGNLGSLKRFKDDVKEVRAGYECGLVIEGFNDIAVDDIIEAYKMVEVPRQEKK